MKNLAPESLMMTHGYKPALSQGSLKCPIFQTSTFVFESAEQGKAYFELAYGLRELEKNEELGLIYSRLNNPDLEILENRLCLWDEAEECAVFESGMSAISTALLSFLAPGDVLLFSNPVYGGTDHFIRHFLTRYGIQVIGFDANDSQADLVAKLTEAKATDKLKMIFIESPANPTNQLIDIAMCKQLAKQFSTNDHEVVLAVDNTYMGPLWQHPLAHGADLVLYSATKYIGGHSDVIAGACLGSHKHMAKVKELRTFLGNMAAPNTAWLLMRSLETLKVRMDQQALNAKEVASYLSSHPKVEKVYYLGMLSNKNQQEIFAKQCLNAGAMISFDIRGGEKEAFRFLNALRLIKLAVSLGGTESLAEHPASMTHAGVSIEDRTRFLISDQLVRLSIGIENAKDIIWDIDQALATV